MGRIYTIREACDILQIDATTLRRWDREVDGGRSLIFSKL